MIQNVNISYCAGNLHYYVTLGRNIKNKVKDWPQKFVLKKNNF